MLDWREKILCGTLFSHSLVHCVFFFSLSSFFFSLFLFHFHFDSLSLSLLSLLFLLFTIAFGAYICVCVSVYVYLFAIYGIVRRRICEERKVFSQVLNSFGEKIKYISQFESEKSIFIPRAVKNSSSSFYKKLMKWDREKRKREKERQLFHM